MLAEQPEPAAAQLRGGRAARIGAVGPGRGGQAHALLVGLGDARADAGVGVLDQLDRALEVGVRWQPYGRLHLHAWVDDALARRLEASPLSADMQLTLQADGGATLLATVDDNRALMGWLLSQAGSICVQAPQALRQAMLEQLRQSLALHEDGC